MGVPPWRSRSVACPYHVLRPVTRSLRDKPHRAPVCARERPAVAEIVCDGPARERWRVIAGQEEPHLPLPGQLRTHGEPLGGRPRGARDRDIETKAPADDRFRAIPQDLRRAGGQKGLPVVRSPYRAEGGSKECDPFLERLD